MIKVPCEKLVLAGGPWTPAVYEKLFPSSAVHLELVMDAGDWMVFRNPNPSTEKSIAFIGLNNIVHEKLEFAGRDDGTIWVCGRRDTPGALVPLGTAGEVNVRMVAELTGRSYRFLQVQRNDDPESFEELQVESLGRSFRPCTRSGLPMMSAVSLSQLCERSSRREFHAEGASNVFLCWGHGSYGLTLGPGSGKVMSQLIRGKDPDIDISPFIIPGKSGGETCSADVAKTIHRSSL